MMRREDMKPNVPDDWSDDEEEEMDDEEEEDYEESMMAAQQREDTVAALLTLAHGSNDAPRVGGNRASGGGMRGVDSELNTELSHARRMQVKVSRMFLAAASTFETLGAAVLELGVPVDDDTTRNMKFTEADVDVMVRALQTFSSTLKGVCDKVGERTGRQISDDLKREVALNTAPHPTAPPSHAPPTVAQPKQQTPQQTFEVADTKPLVARAPPPTVQRAAPTTSKRALPPSSKQRAVVGNTATRPTMIGAPTLKRIAPAPYKRKQEHAQPPSLAAMFTLPTSSAAYDMMFDLENAPMLAAHAPMHALAAPMMPSHHHVYGEAHSTPVQQLLGTANGASLFDDDDDDITPAKLMAQQMNIVPHTVAIKAKRDISRDIGGPSSTTLSRAHHRHHPYADVGRSPLAPSGGDDLHAASSSSAFGHAFMGEMITAVSAPSMMSDSSDMPPSDGLGDRRYGE